MTIDLIKPFVSLQRHPHPPHLLACDLFRNLPFIHCFIHSLQQAASILSAPARIYHPPTRLRPIRVMLPHVPAYQRPAPSHKSRRHRNPARRKGAGARFSRLSTATARRVRFLVWIFHPPVPLPRYLGRHLWGPGLVMIMLAMGTWAPPLHDPLSLPALPRAESAPLAHMGRVERFMAWAREWCVLRPHPGGEVCVDGGRDGYPMPWGYCVHHLPAHKTLLSTTIS